MFRYTYRCGECGYEFTIGSHKKAPFKQTHITMEKDKLFECKGEFYRVWKPTQTFMRGVGYKTNDSPWE